MSMVVMVKAFGDDRARLFYEYCQDSETCLSIKKLTEDLQPQMSGLS